MATWARGSPAGAESSIPFATRPASRTPRRPLVGVAIVFLAGTGLGLLLPIPFWVPWIAAAVGLVGICLCEASAVLFGALLFAGWSAASLAEHPPGRTQLVHLLHRPAEAITLSGVIVDDPVGQASDAADAGDSWVFLLAVHQVDRQGALIRSHGRIRCRWDDPGQTLRYGQEWLLHGVVRDQHRLQPGAYRRHRLAMTITDPDPRLLDQGRGNPLFAACFRARRAAARILDAGLTNQPEKAGLLKALMLGYRSDLAPELKQTFKVTGTLHIFAISGLHVAVFGSLIVGLLRTLGLPRYRWSLILAPVLIGYVIGTGMKPSALRACVMALAFWSGPTFWRKPDALSALALAALLIVGARPQELVSPGFVLSFSVVAGILAFYPLFNGLVRDRLHSDPWQRDRDPIGIRLARRLSVSLWSLFALSLACWLISFPLTARLFQLFSPVGLIGNLVVVPGAFLVVLTGCLSLVTGVFSTVLAEIFNHANAVFIGWLLMVVKGMAAVPLGHRYVAAPAVGWIVGWYLLLGGWRMLAPSRRARWTPVLVVAVAGWILSWSLTAHSGWLRVSAMDGVSQVQICAGRDPVVVGVGDVWHAERLVGSLRSRGINRIQVLAMTSVTEAEWTGAERLLMDLPIEELWLPAALSPEWSARLRAYDVTLRRLREGETGFLEDGTEWEVLALPAPNLGGPVLRIARGLDAAVIMVEPDPAVQYALTRTAIEPAATVLILSDSRHPPELLPAWLDDTGATRVVASRKRRLSRDDDYRRWRRGLDAQVAHVDLLIDGEFIDLPARTGDSSFD